MHTELKGLYTTEVLNLDGTTIGDKRKSVASIGNATLVKLQIDYAC